MSDPTIRSGRSSRIRVAHVIQSLNYGGMERLLASLVTAVDQEQFEQHIIVLQFLGRFAEGLEGVARLHLCRPMPRGSLLWPVPLVSLIRGLAPDIVHTHSGVWFKGSWAARLARVPLVVHTEHGRPSPDRMLGRIVDGVASRWTDVVVAVSSPLSEQLARSTGTRPSKIRVIPNGIATKPAEAFDAASIRQELGLEIDAPLIGTVSRLAPIKGPDLLVEAFGKFLAHWPGNPRPALVVVGEGEMRGAVESRARALGISDRIRWLGWRDDVERFLSAFDIFTLTSRSEGTSIALLEAMWAGRCPVVTDVGGNRAVLGPGLRHRLVPSLDPDAIAGAWLSALTDGGRLADSKAARARVETEYSVTTMAARYQDLYHELAGALPTRARE